MNKNNDQEFTQEDIDELNRIRKQKEQQKAINFKRNIELLVQSLEKAKIICRYDVKEKDYPSDINMYFDEGRKTLKNPTIVRYIAKAECKFIEKHQSEVMQIVVDEIEKELDEIRGILG